MKTDKLFGILISGLLLFGIFVLFGVFIYSFYKTPRFHDRIWLREHYPEHLILRTGGQLAHPEERSSHFLNVSPSKPKEGIRIGAFGDSSTYGYEVDKNSSYPHQLQRILRERFPHKQIEVLNFGFPGHSFHQQFVLWEEYAKNYALDYILFGPQGFHSARDLTFGFPILTWARTPKARFVLQKNGDIRLAHIRGNTLKERYKRYYRLIPTWTALKYDKRPFAMAEILFPFLRENLSNPFYYQKTFQHDSESPFINKILLERIKEQHNKKILFLTDTELLYLFKSYKSIKDVYNLNVIEFEPKGLGDIFYHTFWHDSALGQERWAKIYFHTLLGEENFSLPVVKCSFKDVALRARRPINLSTVRSMQITDGGENSLASLKNNVLIHQKSEEIGSYFHNKRPGTKSFIAFVDQRTLTQPFRPYFKSKYNNKLLFFPVSFQLKEGMSIDVRLGEQNQAGVRKAKSSDSHNVFEGWGIGEVKSLDSHGIFFVVYGDFAIKTENFMHNRSYFILKRPLVPPFRLYAGRHLLGFFESFSAEDRKDVAFWSFNTESIPDDHHIFEFVPVHGYNPSYLTIGSSHPVRERDLPEEFPLFMKYNMENGESVKSLIPDWTCKKEKEHFHLNLPHLEPLDFKDKVIDNTANIPKKRRRAF